MADALRAGPEVPFEVWIYTASSWEGPWVRAAAPLAAGVSSLGLHEEGGRLALTALPQRPPTALEELRKKLVVRGFLAEAGLTRARAGARDAWAPTSWPVDDPDSVSTIDPQRLEGQSWYYAALGRQGDPARADGDHALRSSPPAQERLRGPGLADPSPVRFHGELLLFATAHPEAVVEAAGDPLAQIGRFSGVTVPFAREVPVGEGSELLLLAQAVLDGRRQPVRSLSADGRNWSAWSPVLDPAPPGSCTSPVLGALSDGWMLACVEEPGP